MRMFWQRVLAKVFAGLFRICFRWRLIPFCPEFGTGRGGSISHEYVDRFVMKNRDRVFGRVLDFGNRSYEKHFDSSKIISYDVFDIVKTPVCTLRGDIQNCPEIPKESFDVIICTQVLEHVAAPEKALSELYRLLAPGGLLLLSVPFHSFIHGSPDDYWRFTPSALKKMVSRWDFETVHYDGYGNTYAAGMYSLGLGLADISREMMESHDDREPLVLTCEARKRK